MPTSPSAIYPFNIGSGGFPISVNLTSSLYTIADIIANNAFITTINISDITDLKACSTDTVDRTLQIYAFDISNNPYLLSTILIPANAGNSTSIPCVDLLNSNQLPCLKDSNGSSFLRLNSVDFTSTSVANLGAIITTAPTAGKTISVSSMTRDYLF